MKRFLAVLNTIVVMLVSTGCLAAGETLLERQIAAAKAGDSEAQYDIAYRYEKGRGVEQDEEIALSWFRKAAEKGLDKAQYKLGMFYLDGIGVDPNPAKAQTWLGKAAVQGYPPAQYQLGKFYAANDHRDYERALNWLEKARTNGYEPATSEIRKIRKLSTAAK